MFLIKIVQKKEIKKPKTNNKRKEENHRKKKRKTEKAKGKQNKKSTKEICQGNYEKKRYNLSNLGRRF